MQTVLDRTTIENAEKEKHNAMINERYRKLLDAVEDQFAASTVEERGYAPACVAEKPIEVAPVVEEAPTVIEYRPSELVSSLFTPNRYERVEEQPVQEVAVLPVAPVQVAAKTVAATQYSLTPFAKMAMAIFACVIVAMLTLIGINSQIIHRKSVRLQNLEEKKQELVEKNAEMQRYIQELQTEESIIERAMQAGYLN